MAINNTPKHHHLGGANDQSDEIIPKRREAGQTNLDRLTHGRQDIVGLCAVMIGVLGIGNALIQRHDMKNAINNDRIVYIQRRNDFKNLQRRYDRLGTVQPVTETEGTQQLASAVKAGDKLAAIQNSFSTVSPNNNKVLNKDKKAMSALVGANADTAPWYTTGHKNVPSTWKFESRFTFSQSSATVVFTCTGKEGQLYAYTTADYIPAKKKFIHIHVHTTELGNQAEDYTPGQHQKGSTDAASDVTKDVNRLRKIQQHQKLPKGTKKLSPKQQAEEQRKVAMHQAEEREKYQKKTGKSAGGM